MVTSLGACTMPFLRYNLGDECRLLSRPCSCGSNFPLLDQLRGRDSDLIQLPSGRLRTYDVVAFVLRRFHWIDQFLVIQESLDRFVAQLVASRDPPSGALERIQLELLDAFGEPVEVQVELVEHIPPQPRKTSGFVSRLTPPST